MGEYLPVIGVPAITGPAPGHASADYSTVTDLATLRASYDDSGFVHQAVRAQPAGDAGRTRGRHRGRPDRPDGSQFLQLQYSQTVMLRFFDIDWPHVSVGTLIKT